VVSTLLGRSPTPARAGLPVWVQALAVAAGAVAVPGRGHVPAVIAVWCVAVLAKSCIVAEPGDVDLGEGQGRPERLAAMAGPRSEKAAIGGHGVRDRRAGRWIGDT
jgi:hypothetical protein